MTKKDVLIKIAKLSETTKFTALGLGVGAIPGASEFIRAQTVKDPEIRKRIRQNAFKRLGVGLPVGGSIGYLAGKGSEMMGNVNETFKRTKDLDVEGINKGIKNISDSTHELGESIKDLKNKDKGGRFSKALKVLFLGK